MTDPSERASLAAVRSLGRSGIRVIAVGEERGLAGASRYCSSFCRIPAFNAVPPEEWRAKVCTVVRDTRATLILPVSDTASRLLIGHEAEVGARVLGPGREAYERASDKGHLMEVAERLGIRVPKQATLESRDDKDPVAATRFPIVVKPSRSVIELQGALQKVGVAYAADQRELSAVLAAIPPEAFPVLLQERIIGEGVGIFLLREDGRTLLQFAHRRIREKPPSGGVSTYRESIDAPRDLVRMCERLLDVLGYEGAAMLEFKCDRSTGEFALMEINARLWGSLQLAIDAGVDFPLTMVRRSQGLGVSATSTPKIGARTYWELGELDHALALAFKSRDQLHLPADMPVGFLPAFRSLWDRRIGDNPEVFRLRDWKPFVSELLRYLRLR